MEVFFGRIYSIIEECIGDISSAEYPEGKEEGFHVHSFFPRLGMTPDISSSLTDSWMQPEWGSGD